MATQVLFLLLFLLLLLNEVFFVSSWRLAIADSNCLGQAEGKQAEALPPEMGVILSPSTEVMPTSEEIKRREEILNEVNLPPELPLEKDTPSVLPVPGGTETKPGEEAGSIP
jgi:hypothetical protein